MYTCYPGRVEYSTYINNNVCMSRLDYMCTVQVPNTVQYMKLHIHNVPVHMYTTVGTGMFTVCESR